LPLRPQSGVNPNSLTSAGTDLPVPPSTVQSLTASEFPGTPPHVCHLPYPSVAVFGF